MKAMIDRNQPMSEADKADLEYKKIRTEQIRKEVAGSQVPELGDEAKIRLQDQLRRETMAYENSLNDPMKRAESEARIDEINKHIELMNAQKQSYANRGKKDPTLEESIVDVMAGLVPPEQLPVSALPEGIPQSFGQADGGEVLGMPGQGEYLPGYEPKQAIPAVPAMLRNKFGISQGEASRKALGISKQPDVYRNVDMLIKQLQKNGMYEESKIVEKMKSMGASPEDIYIKLEEYRNAQ
jgi:hypothetical protein